jgi:hypothetical protein
MQSTRPALQTTALLIGFALFAAGCLAYRPFSVLGPDRLAEGAGLLVLLGVVGAVLLQYSREHAHAALVVSGLVVLVAFAGFPIVAATILQLLAALALGSVVVRSQSFDAALIALACGLALIAGIAGWLLPFPIHQPWLWAGVLGAIVLLRRLQVMALVRAGRDGFRAACQESPKTSMFSLGMLLLACTPALLPAMGSDDLSYHLLIPWELAELHYHRLDAASQMWAAAPWGSDVLHALPQLVSGVEHPGVLSAAWLIIGTLLVRQLTRALGASPATAWLASAAFCTIPLASALTSSMQTEPAAAAMALALALLVTRSPREPDAAVLRIACVLAASVIGMKVLHVVVAAPVAIWLLWWWRFRLPWKAVPGALALALLAGGSSLAFAAAVTGNPVPPLLNGVFASPFYPADLALEGVWAKGVDALLPWRLTFNSGDYIEGLAGSAGFVLVALLGGIVVALLRPGTRPLALAGLAMFLLPLSQTQYLRYAYPGIALLIPAAVAALDGLRPRVLLPAGLATLAIAQWLILPSASWMLNAGALRTLIESGERAVLERFVPERILARQVREGGQPGDRVLFANQMYAYGAELPGRAFVVAWYDPILSSYVPGGDGAAADWNRVIATTGANHVIVRSSAMPAGLLERLREGGYSTIAAAGDARLLRLHPSVASSASGEPVAGGVDATFAPQVSWPSIVDARVRMDCSRPSSPVAVSWTVSGAGQPESSYEWITCNPDGQVVAQRSEFLPPGAAIQMTARSTSVDEAQSVAQPRVTMAVRRDLARERDYAARLQQGCRGDACVPVSRGR